MVVLSSRLDFYKETISRKEYNSKLKYFDKKKPILVLVGGGIKTQSGTLEKWTGELEEDELGEAPEKDLDRFSSGWGTGLSWKKSRFD